jgi:hypothetical protein
MITCLYLSLSVFICLYLPLSASTSICVIRLYKQFTIIEFFLLQRPDSLFQGRVGWRSLLMPADLFPEIPKSDEFTRQRRLSYTAGNPFQSRDHLSLAGKRSAALVGTKLSAS